MSFTHILVLVPNCQEKLGAGEGKIEKRAFLEEASERAD